MAGSQDQGSGKGIISQLWGPLVDNLTRRLSSWQCLYVLVVLAVLGFTFAGLNYSVLPWFAAVIIVCLTLVLTGVLMSGRLVRRPTILETHAGSLEDFLSLCKQADRGTFINVQVDLVEWFNPWAQVHLALQDSAARLIQCNLLSPLTNPSAATLDGECLMPFRRILVVPEEWNQLETEIHSRGSPESNLRPLIDIHSCMASPLGILCVNTFAQIIKDLWSTLTANKRQNWARTVGLRVGTIESLGTDGNRAKKSLKKDLSRMRMSRGQMMRSIDCAVLYRNSRPTDDSNGFWQPCDAAASGGPHYSVWQAVISRKGILSYYPVSDQGLQQLGDRGIDCRDITKKAGATEVREQLKMLSDILDDAVFCQLQAEDASLSDAEGKRNPVLGFLRKTAQGKSVRIIHPRPDFDPFRLLGGSNG